MPDEPTTPDPAEFKPISSQDELNRIIGERVAREKAKYADYADLKAKASKFDESEAARKDDLDKANDKIAALAADLEAERKTSLRARIQAKHSISDDDAELFLTGNDEETLTRQAEALAGKVADRKKNGNHVPREGHTTEPQAAPLTEFTRGLFGRKE